MKALLPAVGIALLLACGLSARVVAQNAGPPAPETASDTDLPSPEEIRRKKAELDERARKLELLERPASPDQLAELETRRKAVEALEGQVAQLKLALRLTEIALEKLEAKGAGAIRIERYELVGKWGSVTGEAVLREAPEAAAAPVRTLAPRERVYVLAEVEAGGPWVLVAVPAGSDAEVGFTNRTFVETQ